MFYHSQFRSGDLQAIANIQRKSARSRQPDAGLECSEEGSSLAAMQTRADEMEQHLREEKARIQSLEDRYHLTATEMTSFRENLIQQSALTHDLVQYLLDSTNGGMDPL